MRAGRVRRTILCVFYMGCVSDNHFQPRTTVYGSQPTTLLLLLYTYSTVPLFYHPKSPSALKSRAGRLVDGQRKAQIVFRYVRPYRPDVHREENVQRKTNINK